MGKSPSSKSKPMMKSVMKTAGKTAGKGAGKQKVASLNSKVRIAPPYKQQKAAIGQTGTSTVPKTIVFPDQKCFPDFKPNLTPSQMFRLGSFMDQGGYFRPIVSKTCGNKLFKDPHKEFPASWWVGIDEKLLRGDNTVNSKPTKSLNKYGVGCGLGLDDWEAKQWINKQDPYGWVHWYCRFYQGRRSADDERQIGRWLNLTGPKGRFKNNLVNQVKRSGKQYNDASVSPVIRQVLQHWGYQLTAKDCS